MPLAAPTTNVSARQKSTVVGRTRYDSHGSRDPTHRGQREHAADLIDIPVADLAVVIIAPTRPPAPNATALARSQSPVRQTGVSPEQAPTAPSQSRPSGSEPESHPDTPTSSEHRPRTSRPHRQGSHRHTGSMHSKRSHHHYDEREYRPASQRTRAHRPRGRNRNTRGPR